MCGINGFSWADESLIRKMNEATKHRGPDEEGIFIDENLSFGHVRLSILDLSPRGHQPMFYSKKEGASSEAYNSQLVSNAPLVIVFNGEIYNFMELKKGLRKKGYKFATGTDTEVILASYLEWGPECVEKFNGMWAFALYDAEKKRILLSRDRFGIKPLYYHYDGQNIIFSSEIKGILTHSIPRIPNDDVIFDFLYYNLVDHTEDTFFEGIKRLMPGHNAIFDIETRKLKVWRYYNLRERISKGVKADPERFRHLFKQAVKRRLIADVPVGSCLSGGLDSSSIVCMMREIEQDADIRTFSLVFPGFKLDESKYQEEVVKKCRVEWNQTTFGAEDILNDIMDLIRTQEEPFSTLSIYGQYRVMKLAREREMKVLLDGQGSDEILAGYHYFFGYYYYELFKALKWRILIREILSYRKKTGSNLALRYFFGLLLPERLQRWILNRGSILRDEFLKEHSHRKDPRFRRKPLNQALVDAVLYTLPSLLRFEDKNSMRWSIETRVPFLDPELVEYVLSTDSTAKIWKGTTKVILRDALKGVVPEAILKRTDKIGFATPDKEMANSTKIKEFIWDVISSESFKNRKYWDWRRIHEIYKKGKSNGVFIGEIVWKAVILELWLREWIDGEKE